MKKFLLSTALILASTAYVAFGRQPPAGLPALADLSALSGPVGAGDASSPTLALVAVQSIAAGPPPPDALPAATRTPAESATQGRRPSIGAPVTLASATPPSLAAMPLAGAAFKDGTYTGTPADAYFGTVQVRAVISGGKLASVDVLNYPADRSRSRALNSYALPQLATEVVRAQSANINIVSGATLTSEAYTRSVAAALAQASG